LNSPAMAYIAPLKISLGQRQTPDECNLGPPSRVFKHDAPNRDTTSRTPPPCRSYPNQGFRPKTTPNSKREGDVSTSRRHLQGGERHPRVPPPPARQSRTRLSSEASHIFHTPRIGAPQHPWCSHRRPHNTSLSWPKCPGSPATRTAESNSSLQPHSFLPPPARLKVCCATAIPLNSKAGAIIFRSRSGPNGPRSGPSHPSRAAAPLHRSMLHCLCSRPPPPGTGRCSAGRPPPSPRRQHSAGLHLLDASGTSCRRLQGPSPRSEPHHRSSPPSRRAPSHAPPPCAALVTSSLIRPKRIYFPEHFCYCFSSNLSVLNTTNTD
jgi:hypothetical protein